MQCIVCDRNDVYHRAVVRLGSDDTVGLFCKKCERAIFGEVFQEYMLETKGCVICDGAGRYELPRWVATNQTMETDGNVILYELAESQEAPILCSAHFQGLRSTDP